MSLIPEIDAFLGCPTPDAWIEAALADQETLLIDHKNCEKKAAMQPREMMSYESA
ncbi:MAG: tRNA isopentenyl-2-thiomethyl-A-37 hydroxylase MiaE [Pseudomonas putida]